MPDPNTPLANSLTLDKLHKAIPHGFRSEIPSTPKSLPPEVDRGELMPEQWAEYALQLIAAYSRAMTDSLELYLPLPEADRFHASTSRIRMIKGSNRAGKTNSATAEFARIWRGRDPYMKRRDGGLNMLAVGKDTKHLGSPMWRKLYFPGAFEIVPDEDTGMWRAVRPDPLDPRHIDPIDLGRQELWKPGPSFIPPSEIETLSWENKAEGVPSLAVLKNGSQARFCASGAFPRQGDENDTVWFDEEIENKKWLGEALRSTVKPKGILFWSYTPQASTPQAFTLYRRAEAGEAGIEAFFMSIEDNPYLDDEARAAFYRDCAAEGDEHLAVCYYGRDAILGRMVYPTYDLDVHGTDAHPIPDNWMRVTVIDPGTRRAAVLFGAVPPTASHVEIYEERVVENKDAFALGQEIRRIEAMHSIEARVIDKKGAQPRTAGRSIGDSTADHYMKEFERAGVWPARLQGRGFVWSNPDTQSRELTLKAMLTAKTMRLHRGRTYRLDKQMKARYYDKHKPHLREARSEHDLTDCCEYLAAFFEDGIYYHAPEKPRIPQMARRDANVIKAVERLRKAPEQRARMMARYRGR